MGNWIALGLIIIAGLILVLRHDSGTIAGFDMSDFAGLVAGLALLIYLGGALRNYRGGLTGALRDIALWALLALFLVAGYSYRDDLKDIAYRVAGELLPAGVELPAEIKKGEGQAVRLRRQLNGHFVARTRINDIAITMIVDTGASMVVLTQEDAERLGIDLKALRYNVIVRTANGISKSARFRLPQVAIGPVLVTNVDTLISAPDALHQSLLGISFLSQLRSYEFSGDFLTLRN